jgi:hypothetical protein
MLFEKRLDKLRVGMQDTAGKCNLDDRFAGPLGVLACLREDAAEIGFVDHWTAWGAGQDGTPEQANQTLRNMGEFMVVCNDGCRHLSQAIEVRELPESSPGLFKHQREPNSE